MRKSLVSMLAVLTLAVSALAQAQGWMTELGALKRIAAERASPVDVTDGYFVGRGRVIHLVGHGEITEPALLALGDEYTLYLHYRQTPETTSPCDGRAKVACQLITEVYGVAEDGTRTYAFGWEGLEFRLNPGKYSIGNTIPGTILRDKAPIGKAVLVLRWVHKDTELHRLEIPLRITG